MPSEAASLKSEPVRRAAKKLPPNLPADAIRHATRRWLYWNTASAERSEETIMFLGSYLANIQAPSHVF
jgi:hypothetical protein